MPPTPVVLRNARLVGEAVGLHSIAIRDGVIAAVTPQDDGGSDQTTESLDLDGRWVLPGLWDHHVHFEQWAIARDRCDLSSAESAAHAAKLIAGALATRGGADLIVGVGYRDALWADPPTARLLDERTGNVPAVLISADLHATWLNTAALRRFGHAENATGVLREQPAFDVQLAASDLPRPRIDQLVAAATTAAARRGVVGIVDFEWPDIAPSWARRIADGVTSLRVVCSVWPQQLAAASARGLRSGDPIPGTGGLATMGPLKVIIDGSLNTRTAYCFDPYPGAPAESAHGVLTVAPDELLALLSTARQAGLGAAVHAIGDHAISIALDAFERAHFTRSARCSIEHVQLTVASDVGRMARLGLIASVQPEHAVDDRDVADRYWPGRTGQAFAYRSLADAGIPLAFGSDAPVAPLDPWVAIAAAVLRSGDERPPWHPEQHLSIAQSLRATTHGRIEAGSAADLAVVDADPLTCSPHQCRAMPVVATMLAGRWTHLDLG